MDVFAALAGHAMGGRGDLRPVPQLERAQSATPIVWSSRAMPAGACVRLRIPPQRRRRGPRATPDLNLNTHIERWP